MWIEKLNKLNPKKGESISIQIRVMRPEAETNKITDLQNRQEQIKEGKKHIDHMMNWR